MKHHSKNTLLYLAIGKTYISQAIVSLVSLLCIYKYEQPEVRVVILTDNSISFEWLRNYLNLDVRIVSPDWIKEAQGPQNFALRTKIIAIRDVLFNDFTNVLFVDTDTIFSRKIDPLFSKLEEGFCFLHKKEWPLCRGRLKNKALCPRDLNFELDSGAKIEINGSTEMWNSGVVGVYIRNRELLLDSLDLNDRLYKIYPSWHVEQFSLSIILQATGRLHGCRLEVYHYWHNKPLFEKATKRFFSLIAEGRYEEAMTEAGKIIPLMIFQMRAKYFLSQVKVWLRDLPGVYECYKIFIKQYSSKPL